MLSAAAAALILWSVMVMMPVGSPAAPPPAATPTPAAEVAPKIQPSSASAVATPLPTVNALSIPVSFIYGVSVSDLKNAPMVAEMDFQWMKGHISWQHSEPEQGEYNWGDLDKALATATENGLGLLLRVDQAPDWSHPSNPDPSAPPDPEYLPDWERFLALTAARAMGRAQAYEIWNEPNLALEWGGNPPDPDGYARLLASAYRAVKLADPGAIVVSAGLANTEEQSASALDDAVFLERFYQAGGGAYMDVLGYHPHAGPDTAEGYRFRRAELQRRIMEAHGDAGKPVWATELAWIARPPSHCAGDPRWSGRLWESVEAEEQARYLADAFTTIRRDWRWMQAAFIFNLDFSLAPWYDECEPMAYESMMEEDGSPRPVFLAMQAMAKEGARPAPSMALPSGPLVKGSCADVWMVVDGVRRWVPDYETLLAAGHDLEDIVQQTDEEVRRRPLGSPVPSVRTGRYPDNTLLKLPNADRIYAVRRGLLRPVPNLGTFDANSYCWSNVREVSQAELDRIPPGKPLPRAAQLAYVCEVDGRPDICIANADGISRRRLTSGPSANTAPAWQPAQDTIAFVSDRDGRPHLYAIDSAGKDLRQLTAGDGDDLAPSYSPDEVQLVFLSNRGGRWQPWVMMGDGQYQRPLAEVEGEVRQYGWQGDGSGLLFAATGEDGREVWWKAKVELPPELQQETDEAGDDEPLLRRAAAAEVAEIVDRHALPDAQGERRPTIAGQPGVTQAWSPGGERLAWWTADGQDRWTLHSVEANGLGYERLATGLQPEGPLLWSPEGGWLAFVARQPGVGEAEPRPAIWTVRFGKEGPEVLRLTDDRAVEHSPAWLR